jgi:hypothetical protein
MPEYVAEATIRLRILQVADAKIASTVFHSFFIIPPFVHANRMNKNRSHDAHPCWSLTLRRVRVYRMNKNRSHDAHHPRIASQPGGFCPYRR